MKSIFSQISKSSLSNHAKRLTMAVVFLSFAAIATAGGGGSDSGWTGTAKVTATAPTGLGVVYVEGGTTTTGEWTESATTSKTINDGDKSLNFKLTAKPAPRYCFTTWTNNGSSGDLSDITSTDNPAIGTIAYKEPNWLGSGEVKNPSVSYTANFARVISGIKADKIFVWKENDIITSSSATVEVPVKFAQANDILTIEITGTGDAYLPASDIMLYDEAGNNVKDSKQIARHNSEEKFVFSVSYIGTSITDIEVLIQKKIKLHVVAKGNPDDRDWEDVEITLAEPSTLTFKGTNGKGTYSSNRLLSSSETNSNRSFKTTITDMALLKGVTLSLTTDPTDGEIFYAWKMTKADGTESYLSYAESCTAPDLEGGETFEAVFIPNSCAFAVMNGNSGKLALSDNTVYSDLHLALTKANELYIANNKKQYVVFDNLATLFSKTSITRSASFEQPSAGKEGVLQFREGGYTIPKGITLLIPGDATYKYSASYEIDKTGTPTGMYRKMTVARNTKIYVNYGAEIIVYATIYAYKQTWAGIPFDHGQIELGMGSEIILGDPDNDTSGADGKAKLNALGYVTNTEEVVEGKYNEHGKVTAYRGAYVHEILQYTNWRGGDAAKTLASDKKVFPIPQYYIQNIEAPAIFHTGAVEEVTAMAHVSSMALDNSATYIGTGSDGFFALGNKMKIIKYYDRKNDTQKYILEGESASKSTVDFNNISLTFGALFISITIHSSDYPLPISSNFDVEIDKATVNFKYNIIALPGVKLLLKKDAIANILEGEHSDKKTYPATMYIYDEEQAYYLNGSTKVSYMGSIGTPILQPLFYTPYGSQTTTGTSYSTKNYKRTHENAETILDIRGILNVGKDYSSTSVLYTTAGYGQIVSAGEGGKIKFYNIDNGETPKKTEQFVNLDGGKYVDFSVTNAVLTNVDGSTVETASAAKGTLFTYTNGKWIPSQKWTVKDFEVTLPDQSVTQEIVYAIDQSDTHLSGKTFNATIPATGFEIVGSNSLTFNTNEDLKVQVKYTAQNKHNLTGSVGVLTLKNPDYNITYSTELKAIENYTPKFTGTTEPITMPLTYVGESNVVSVQGGDFQINSTEYNVTSLIKDMDSEYYQNLTWDWESTNSAFTFAFGDGRNALSDAKITFTPTTAGPQSATITLTAKYTDATPTDIPNTEEVKLVVNAEGANLAANTLKLTDDCKAALEKMCVNVPITLEFDGLTANKNSLEVTIDNNGTPESPILTLDGDGTSQKPFVVTANAIPTTTRPIIKVTQSKDLTSGVGEGNVTCEVKIGKCEPIVQWNWSDMYFGYSYDNPIKSNSTGDYTLTLKSIKRSNGTPVAPSTVMTYDDVAKTAEVKQNTDEYVATFEFKQDASDLHAAYPTTEFTAHIYASPAQLPLCVDNERIFTAINYASTENGVSYDATTKTIDIAAGAYWTITFIGVPDVLRFVPTTTAQLQIQTGEYANAINQNVHTEEVVAGQMYEFELKPSTKYIKFTAPVDAISLTSLCVDKLERVRLTPNILYMPIAEDPENAPTTRTITATYVNRTGYPLNIISSDGSNIQVSPNTLPPTEEGEYKEVNITISSKATKEIEAFVSVKYSNSEQAQVDIETYRFPQKLPIQLEKGIDPAKRFHFVTTTYKNTEWDAAQYAVKMQNKTTTEAERPFVTFAFDGAPSFISFVPVVATSTTDWLIKEGVDAKSLNPVKVEATMEDGELKQTLDYTSRYVSVTYVGTSAEVVQMTKVNILSDQSAIPNPEKLELTDENKYVGKNLDLTVVNLTNLLVAIDNEHFTLSYGSETPKTTFALDADAINGVFGEDVVGAIPFKVFWDASQATDFGNITFTTEVDGAIKTLATVPLVGTKAGLTEDEIIYTGVKQGYTLDGKFEGIYGLKDDIEKSTAYRKVDLSSTYDNNDKPLFDYLVIYGETTTTDGTTTVTTPTTTVGSNAKTPMYIYYKDGDSYKFWMMEENVNTANKAISSLPIANGQQLRIYITGFCPYATTGYTKEDEGVWYFQGVNGAKLDIYLEDCYIYSRNKTLEGRAFSGRYDGQAFSEGVVRGSGGVLVFENQNNDQNGSFDVTIHTRRNNMFKSNYGCFFELMQGMRAYNVSSPIQIHLAETKHMANSKTTLTFDDKWPTDASDYSKIERTNGYLSLQKQVNNAPSIDLGNANTIVNFKGGQVELQNAAVVSPNYKTTFAISFRSGLMAGFPMAYGIGTDDVGGTVKFYDGTTTVIPMEVDIKYRDYYLMDTDANGKEKTTTSCLRTPTNTFVYGGSHCMMRACEDVTSKGGAPTRNGNPLGIYKYPKIKATVEAGQTAPRGGFGEPNGVGLVKPTDIPAGYQAESVTPNTNGTDDTSDDYLNFWFTTEEESSVKPEVDKKINFWKACMTQISAQYSPSIGGTIGGETMILPNEENKYLLYCQIDENISNVISAGTGIGEDRVYSYKAPVKDPTGQLDEDYLSIPPSYVGDELQNYIETVTKEDNTLKTGEDYTISEKVYYVVPTVADTWMTFTAPFNVEKLWIVEAYNEAKLAATPLKEVTDEEGNTTILNKRQSVLLEQAKHNADFAAFFGVAMALGRDQTFDEIYNDYTGWAKYVDKKDDTRGKIELEHYNGNNFFTANYYLYHNAGEWTRNGDKFDTQWEVVGEVADGGILMHQDSTYSMLFPYCTGCDVQKDPEGKIIYDANGLPQLSGVRDYWDYWSGKFLIFESTQATSNNPHTIKGSKYHEQLFAPATSGNGSAAVLTGNSTFALMTSYKDIDAKVYTYSAEMGRENFKNNTRQVGTQTRYQTVQPTVSFLIADIPSNAGMPARNVMRTGEIIYGKENTSTDVNQGGNIPTVGGGNDLFITATVAGINIAVAEPQHVRVMAATGAIIYSGMVQTAVDVALPTTGVYVITGENEVHKILH